MVNLEKFIDEERQTLDDQTKDDYDDNHELNFMELDFDFEHTIPQKNNKLTALKEYEYNENDDDIIE